MILLFWNFLVTHLISLTRCRGAFAPKKNSVHNYNSAMPANPKGSIHFPLTNKPIWWFNLWKWISSLIIGVTEYGNKEIGDMKRDTKFKWKTIKNIAEYCRWAWNTFAGRALFWYWRLFCLDTALFDYLQTRHQKKYKACK